MAEATFVVVGGGQSGGWTAHTLRDSGFDGRIVLVTEEPYLPYERPPLSKGLLLGEQDVDSTLLWPGDPYPELNVEVRINTRAERILAAERRLVLSGGDHIAYDKLMLATGARVRKLPVPGADLAGVHYLRTIEDTLAIKAALKPDMPVVVVGGGWIGLEVAAACRKLGATVTLLEALDRLCARAVPPDFSNYLLELHRGHGVDVRLGAGVSAFEGEGRIERVIVPGADPLPAAMVVVGIGVVPNVELAQEAGIVCDNGIVVDEHGRTSNPDVFAAGDVTSQPNQLLNRRVRLESWENAQNQAIAAAKAMLGGTEPYVEVPWFWSDQYDVNLQLVGLPSEFEDTIERGAPGEAGYIVFYMKGGKIDGAAAINNARDIRMTKRIMASGVAVDAAQLADPSVKLQKLARG